MQLCAPPGIRLRSLATAAVVVILAAACSGSATGDQPMAYSDLLLRASQGDVESVVQEGTGLSVTLRSDAVPRAVTVSEQLNVLQELCTAAGTSEPGACDVRFEFVEPSASGQLFALLITTLLPVLLIGGFIFFMMRRGAATSRP